MNSFKENQPLPLSLLYQSTINELENTLLLCLDSKYQYVFFNSLYKDLVFLLLGKEPSKGESLLDDFNSYKEVLEIKDFCDMSLKGQKNKIKRYYKIADETIYYEISFIPLYEKEQVLGLSIIAKDLSDYKKIEDQYILAEKNWDSTFDAMSDSVAIINLEGKFIHYNKATLESLNTSDQEIKSGLCWQLVHGRLCSVEKCPFERMKESMKHESQIFVKGEKIINISVDPYFDRDHHLIGAVHVIRDVTEKENLEKKLQVAKERYQMLFDNSPVSLWEEDFSELFNYFNLLKGSGVRDLRSYLNENPQLILSLSEKIKVININKETMNLYRDNEKWEFLKNIGNTFTENSIEYFKEELIELFNGSKNINLESEVQTSDKQIIFISFRLAIISGEDGIVRGFAATIDITKRKLAEREIRNHKNNLEKEIQIRTDELEQKNRELDKTLKVFVGRELTIKKLQKKINELEEQYL